MRHAFILLSLVLGLGCVACNKGGDKRQEEKREKMDPLVEETMVKLTEARDKGCACANLECVTKVQNELGHWYLENAKRLEPLTTKATKEQNEAGQKLSAELDACAKKLQAAGQSAAP